MLNPGQISIISFLSVFHCCPADDNLQQAREMLIMKNAQTVRGIQNGTRQALPAAFTRSKTLG